MPYPLTITASDMREINRSAILEIIRKESPIARSTIAERLDTSLPTIMRIVDGLIDEGLVRAHGTTEWSGGRRRPLLEFNADGFVVLGVDMGGTKMYGAISNLGGKILEDIHLNRHGTLGEDSYEALTNLLDTLLASPKLDGRRVRGIGVGTPGITYHKDGIVKWSYQLGWDNFPLKARLAEKYSYPIIVDNDLNLAALGELWFGAGQNVQNMILIAIGTGIGAGIIIDGALHRGAREGSGEIGYIIPGREFLGKDYTSFGALESVASGTGISERAGLAHPDRKDAILSEEVFDAARKGEKWAWEIIDETVDYLSIAIANLTVTLDPELIVLGGGVTKSADLLIEPIQKRIAGLTPYQAKIVVSTLGLQAGVMGAVTNVLHNTSNYYVVHKLS